VLPLACIDLLISEVIRNDGIEEVESSNVDLAKELTDGAACGER